MVEKKKVIIIIDDDEDLLKLLTFSFEEKGFIVHGITTGKEALQYILDEKNLQNVSLLILDRILPDMDGIDILKQFLKKFQDRVPVLILSVLSSEKDILTGLKHGAVDYETKPFSILILMEKALALMAK